MRYLFSFLLILFALSACSDDNKGGEYEYPKNLKDTRKLERGRLTGEGLIVIGGDDEGSGGSGGGGIGVNSFLWRATLDTVSFMPLISADPFGGVILTDWYEDPKTPGERFKINALIIGGKLRADAIKISLFRQRIDSRGGWRDAEVNPERARKIEDTILTRARQLRVRQLNN